MDFADIERQEREFAFRAQKAQAAAAQAYERLLRMAPGVLGDAWDALPPELHSRWARMQVHCRRARLLAYRVVALQSAGRVSPSDTAAYRIAVTKLDQDSAEVLMEIVGGAASTGPELQFRRAVEDHWRYAQASTVSSGSIEMQRILMARTLVSQAGAR